MIDIKFEIGGKKVIPNSIGEALENAFLKEVTVRINKSLNPMHSPEHNQRPKVKVKGRDINNLSFEVEGCCHSLYLCSFPDVGLISGFEDLDLTSKPDSQSIQATAKNVVLSPKAFSANSIPSAQKT